MKIRIQFCPDSNQFTVATSLARLLKQTGWDLSVELDKEAPRGEFAVYIDGERIFSRIERGMLPKPMDIIPPVRARLFGDD